MAEPAQVSTKSDRRRSSRKRSLKGARIQSLDHKTTFDCVARNLSAKGALLVLPSTVGVPNEFNLTLPAEERTVRCEVAWRDLRRLGVTFQAQGQGS